MASFKLNFKKAKLSRLSCKSHFWILSVLWNNKTTDNAFLTISLNNDRILLYILACMLMKHEMYNIKCGTKNGNILGKN